MLHPYEVLMPEYAHYWNTARTLPSREREVDEAAQRLLDQPHLEAFSNTQKITLVPVLWHGPTLYRESDGNLRTYLGNGDPLDRVTVDVPKGRGPFSLYEQGAEDSLRYDHVSDVVAWTIERMCYEWELWNGFGPRNKGIITSYLVGGTSLQEPGKYVADGRWDPEHIDEQLGTIPIAKRMLELRPELALPYQSTVTLVLGSSGPLSTPVGLGGKHDTAWIQGALNKLGFGPLDVDGSYGRRTRNAVMSYQAFHGLEVDGFAGPKTLASLSTSYQNVNTLTS